MCPAYSVSNQDEFKFSSSQEIRKILIETPVPNTIKEISEEDNESNSFETVQKIFNYNEIHKP
jgi:hypothetical protein